MPPPRFHCAALLNRVRLPTHKKVYTVLSSPHVYKQHRSQYVRKTHKRCIRINNITEETAATFIDYIMDNAPAGVSSRVTMVCVPVCVSVSVCVCLCE